jgi:hypothetical protein
MKKIAPILIIIILLIAVVYVVIGNLKEEEKLDVIEEDIIGVNDDSVINYSNSYYNFSLEIPDELDYCLSDMCIDKSIEDESHVFQIKVSHFLNYQNIEYKDAISTNNCFEIRPRKNSLDMLAVDFAKRSLKLNQQYRPERKYYQEEEIMFAGEKAYTFITSSGFEERGASSTEDGLKDSSEFFEKAGEGKLLDSLHRIIYFDHNGFIYRIIYPLENEIAKDIINSFRFFN